jgi:putative Holliday junction resolvase
MFMSYTNILAFSGTGIVSQRLLALDLGDKTIGVAVSDPLQRLAMPVETIRRGKFAQDAARLAELIKNREIGGLVIGLPLGLDGTEGPRCQSVRQFARNLEKAGIALPTLFWDERMSTAAVERLLIDERNMRRDKRAEVIDAQAAAYILQGVLDALYNLRRAAQENDS